MPWPQVQVVWYTDALVESVQVSRPPILSLKRSGTARYSANQQETNVPARSRSARQVLGIASLLSAGILQTTSSALSACIRVPGGR